MIDTFNSVEDVLRWREMPPGWWHPVAVFVIPVAAVLQTLLDVAET
jgi:hypothetical protein